MMARMLLLSFVGSCVAWPLSRLLGRRAAGWGLAVLPAAIFAAFINMAPAVEAGITIVEHVPWAASLGVDLVLRLDGFSFLFVLLITGIGALVVINAGAYLSDETDAARGRFFTLILLFMTAMLGAVLSDNLVVLFLFWEATSVLSFLLIGFDAESPHARRAALISLRVTMGGGLALLMAVILIGATLDTYSMSEAVTRSAELVRSPWIILIVAGVMLGAFTKSAQFPFHFWLPNAMQAPTPASAYLHSATMVKLGIYLLARFEPLIGALAFGRDVLVTVAAITMLVAAVQALRSENFKSVLANSTVASLGILVLLVGLDGPIATVALVGFILAHALYKATLFFCAGSVLHATGLSKLRSMGGLARFLPVTAAAALLASLSMAGIPPFLGFISKEFLFLAQVESSWQSVPLAVAVLVNAVLVAVAGAVTLRPFFLDRDKVKAVRHGETAGLVLGPAVLALLGLTISLEPDWISRSVLQPAVTAVYGSAVEVDLSVMHGFTPLLALSAAVVGIGALIFVFWKRIHRRLAAYAPLDRYDVEHAYDNMLRRFDALATATVRLVQHGDLRGYVWTVCAAAIVFVAWGLIAAGVAPRGTADWAPRLTELGGVAIALVGVGGAVAATKARTLLSALLAVGLVGFISALIFLTNGAPDLALTQFAVESLVVVLLTVALLVLPLGVRYTRSVRERRLDALLAVAFGALILVMLLDMSQAPRLPGASEFFGARALLEAHGRNVVNVILVDFRAFDTLGETTVITVSAIVAWALLGPRTAVEGALPIERAPTAIILVSTSRIFFWLLLGSSLVILWRGHNDIGGGFVGGLVAALAFSFHSLAHGVAGARALLRVHPQGLLGAGLLLATLSGLPGLFARGEFLTQLWWEPSVAGMRVALGTSVLFDLGVYMVVLGTVLAFLFGLRRQAAR
ncbi:MAG TPA: hydrogen gas-evolving membrane-bound hydrogenase subunit E [Gemmatimonadaceae bacterium]|nr:hydrogen gas-evolving membrane-bound hydrogenase subunit E [Gemmatimonadaceae bacterium]